MKNKDKKKKKNKNKDKADKPKSKDTPQFKAMAAAEAGKYSDGHPLDSIQFLETKIILKGDRFTSAESLRDFGKLVKKAAENSDVDFSTKEFKGQKPSIREVMFADTADFKLYNNAFILRRRTIYENGFLAGDPEIVFKFRHPDKHQAAALDVRPKNIEGYEIKFKAEVLPLKDEIGGIRTLYSHNVQFPVSRIHESNKTSMQTLSRIFPALTTLGILEHESVELVNQTAVEEVLLDIGILDFGKGIRAKANVAVWRKRGDQQQLVGEFAFQAKFKREDELHAIAMKRCEQFFISLQFVAKDWLALGLTKTGAVYRLKGNPPQAHE
jgi:hypothetical protein